MMHFISLIICLTFSKHVSFAYDFLCSIMDAT